MQLFYKGVFMNISSNYGVANYGYNKSCMTNVQKTNKNISFAGYMGHKDTEKTPWGTTWGEERVSKQNAEATKRMIQRETLKNSKDEWVREEAKNVGKNPAWDEYLTQREFNRYHAEVMAERAIKEAKLAAAAGKKNYSDGEIYTVCDKKGRVIERGRGDQWESRYEYDIKYHVNRFGEHYTMNEAVKETRPDDTYVIKASPYSNTRLEEKFKNQSVEYVDNCTGMIKSVKLPDGSSFNLGKRLMTTKQTEESRQYFSQYNDKTPVLEVFNDGNYIQS
jgi:hypothetical protein